MTAIHYAVQGLIDLQTILRTLLLTPPFMLGVWIGAHHFSKSSEQLFLKLVLNLLSVVALATMLL